MSTPTRFFFPTRPFTLAQAVSRMALATGHAVAAQAGTHADYNGHHVTVERGDFAGGGPLHTEAQKEARGWRAHYTWGGIQWLARSTNFTEALAAAVREHARGALGSTVHVKTLTEEQGAACRAAGLLEWSEEIEEAKLAKWRTPAYAAVNDVVRDLRAGGTVDYLAILQSCADAADYHKRVDAALKARRDMVGARR